jgi:ribonuclease PH
MHPVDGRAAEELRPVHFIANLIAYLDGSVLIKGRHRALAEAGAL